MKRVPTAPSSNLSSRPDPRRVAAGVRPGLRRINASYSRFVALMKFLLPVVAVGLVALVVVWPQLQSRIGGLNLGFSSISPHEAENLHMVKARFTRTDDGTLPYALSAELATQESVEADVVLLSSPKADLFLENGTWLGLAAKNGRYTQSKQILELSGSVNLFHDSGYEIHSTDARVDFGEGIMEADTPVTGQGPFGELESEGFRIVDKGRTVYFTGKTRVVIYAGARLPEFGKGRAKEAGR